VQSRACGSKRRQGRAAAPSGSARPAGCCDARRRYLSRFPPRARSRRTSWARSPAASGWSCWPAPRPGSAGARPWSAAARWCRVSAAEPAGKGPHRAAGVSAPSGLRFEQQEGAADLSGAPFSSLKDSDIESTAQCPGREAPALAGADLQRDLAGGVALRAEDARCPRRQPKQPILGAPDRAEYWQATLSTPGSTLIPAPRTSMGA
jgi:hypothetical protein